MEIIQMAGHKTQENSQLCNGNDLKHKAVALLSGGLDSTIATRLIMDMGVDITALNFHTVFCTCTHKGCKFESRQVANEFDLPLKVLSVTKEFMEVVRNPKYGYGSALNPCIDCRIFTFRKAKEFMEEIGASFVITGEILGQRPMSQTNRNMALIEKESGLEGRILRPLSANKTQGLAKDIQKIIDIDKLPNITGRSRKTQYELVEELNIENYSCPSGGCLLTEKEFSRKLKDYFLYNKENDIDQLKLLKTGRHFRISPKAKIIVGRDEKENKKLSYYKHAGILMEPKEKGPIGLLVGSEPEKSDINTAGKIIGRYCKTDKIHLSLFGWEKESGIETQSFTDEESKKYLI
ncbi:MAG: hypothetical protein OEZ36_07690 [Spirochaetota bacterium]|nr:hypothetical protein [Spirochaetota bacterium]